MTHILMSRSILAKEEVVIYLKNYIRSDDKVLVIALSFFNHQVQNENDYHKLYEKNSEYYQKIINQFAPYGIKEENIVWLNYYHDQYEDAIKKINDADIIYFPGGAPDLMMKRIIEMGIKEVLEKQDKLFIGSSAGAMIQFKNYYISKDGDYKVFSYEKGLDLLSGFFIEVHYRRRKTQKSSMRKVFRAYKEDIYSIPDDGMMIVNQNQIRPILTSKRIYHKKGIIK
jgi:peptidase E